MDYGNWAGIPQLGGSGGGGMSSGGMNWGGMLGGLGGLAGGIATLFNNPADKAMGYAEKLPGTVSPYYNPFIESGQNAMAALGPEYMQLMQNPQAIMQMLGSGYQESPGYGFQLKSGQNAINSAAGAGGMLGSPAHQQQSGELATQLANQDYYNYLNNMMGLYGQGLSGNQGLMQQGYNASDALAGMLGQNLMNQGQIAGYGAQQQNNAIGGILGGLGSLVGGLF